MLHRIQKFFFPPSVSTRAELVDFLAGESAYLTQKTVFGYCRVKTMLDYDKLMTEPAFRDAVEACRWEAYASALGDAIILVEGYMRPEVGERQVMLADSLEAIYSEILAAQPMPAHRQTWADWIEAFHTRFALSRQSKPISPEQIVNGTAKLIYEQVPIHPRLKREDFEVILGDLRLHMLAMHAAMLKRFRRDALTAVLVT